MDARRGRITGAVALGSGLGAASRYLCSLLALWVLGSGFVWGTLAANVLGSFLIGLYATLTAVGGRWPAGPVARQFVLAGFCGGFTTFSLFSLETLVLIEHGLPWSAALLVGASLCLWLGAAWGGHVVGARMNEGTRTPGRPSPD